MGTYVVTAKSDGAEVSRYSAVQVMGDEYPLDAFDHTPLPDDPADAAPPAGPRRLTKLQFVDLLGDAAYATILGLAKTEVAIEVFVKRFEMATPDDDGTSISLDDPRTVAGITAIGGVLVAMGVVSDTWAQEVLNG